jgi:signal transduction histidine kinase
MKKNLHLGFIIICTLIVISNIFLFLHSKKGGGVLQEIVTDITPGAIAMGEMANLSSEIGHYALHNAIKKGTDGPALQQMKKAIRLLRNQGEVHLAHEKHIGLEEKKAAEQLIDKINTLSNSTMFLYHLRPDVEIETLQSHELKVVHQAINDLNTILLSHKGVHLDELKTAHTLILSKKNTLNMVIMNSSVILLCIIMLIWWMTIRIHNRFTAEQQTQQKRIELDFIEKKQIEEKLQHAKKMESIGLMAGGVAHDLNNILSGVTGYSELILHDLPEDSKLTKPIKAIQDSGSRAAIIVADLLTVARGAASTRELHNLNSLAQEYLNSPEYTALKSLYPQITCQHQLTAAHNSIICSSVHVKKCLMNLVTNASEAVEADGTIIVSTENKTLGDDTAARYHIEPGEYVLLNVDDDGPGITDKDLEHIFEPFYTKKVMGRSGTGLGLTVVWNTMEDHDGIVLVKSSDEGTCFQLFFPVSKEKKAVQTDSDTQENLSGNGEHILLVDDESHLRDIGTQMLQTLGYKVVSVSSGELAVKFIKDNKVDLLVLDMLMEPGINGLQTYKEILEISPDQKAIIASGFSESDDVKATLKLGAGKFIKKPYSTDQLGQAVKEVLNN